MKITFLPKTILGKWSAWLSVAFLLLFAFFQTLVMLGQRGGETFADNWLLSIPIFTAGACVISAAILGIISFFKKERSILVMIITLIGLLALFFVIGEFTSPH